MQTPNITLTSNLKDLSGAAVSGCSIEIILAGFGAQLPRVAGTTMLATIAPPAISESGSFSVALWGNDVITPSGTFYVITILDPQGNVVQSGTYQLTGSGTLDLSIQTPYEPATPVPPIPVPPGDYFQYGEIPAGAIDGTNATFTLTKTPAPASSHRLYLNGRRLIQGVGYTLNGNSLTYASAYIPQPAAGGEPADSHVCDYQYAV